MEKSMFITHFNMSRQTENKRKRKWNMCHYIILFYILPLATRCSSSVPEIALGYLKARKENIKIIVNGRKQWRSEWWKQNKRKEKKKSIRTFEKKNEVWVIQRIWNDRFNENSERLKKTWHREKRQMFGCEEIPI